MEKDKNGFEKPQRIGVYDFGTPSVLKIDLSFLNLKFYKLDSKQFKTLCDNVIPYDNGYTFGDMSNNSSGYHPNLYALVPIDFTKSIDAYIFFYVERLLLVMFPSDFHLLNLVELDSVDETDTIFNVSGWRSYSSQSHWYVLGSDLEELHLRIDSNQIRITSHLFKEFWSRISKESYLNIGIESYADGFKLSLVMGFLSYCIALESLSEGQQEVTDKISRICAVLNSNSKEEGHTIYKNMKKIYGLRSKIVHGEKFSSEKIHKYFFYLQSLASRTLLELLSIEVTERTKLFELINQSGFGDKSKFSKNKTLLKFNLKVSAIIKQELE